jgi:hypothetical protein
MNDANHSCVIRAASKKTISCQESKFDLAKHIMANFTDFDPAHPGPLESVSIPARPGSAGSGANPIRCERN